MSQDLKFITAVSGYTTKGLVLRGKPMLDLIEDADFVSSLFLSLTGRIPKKNEKKIFNAVLVACLDHGINPASGFVPRVAASSGGDVLSCMATTLLSLGPNHGGSVTLAMRMLKQVDEDGDDKEFACEKLIDAYRLEQKRIPGFGHPKYKNFDPRAKLLFEMARKEDLNIDYMNLAKQMEHSLEQKLNIKLILNIDGALAALLLAMKIDTLIGNAIFGLARTAGSIAHIIEEQTSNKGVRVVNDEDIGLVLE